jgi:predicted nucleic acid-binding protein
VPALVDTSAWIEFFHPKGMETVKQIMAVALEEGIVVTAAPVLTELLVGIEPKHPAGLRAIQRLGALYLIDIPWNACARAAQFGRKLARQGRRAPTVDLMIAGAAFLSGHDVWHVGDRHFADIERVGGPHQRDLAQRLPSRADR